MRESEQQNERVITRKEVETEACERTQEQSMCHGSWWMMVGTWKHFSQGSHEMVDCGSDVESQ